MSKDITSKNPGGNQPNSPKPRHNEKSPSQSRSMDEDDDGWTEDDDSDQTQNDRTDRSIFSSSPETLSPLSLRSCTAYKSTSFTQTETIETISKLPPCDLRREKKLKVVQPKKVLAERTKKNTSKESNSSISTNCSIRKCVFCLLLPIAFGSWFLWITKAQSSTIIPMQEDRFKLFVNDLKAIKNKFPHQNDRSWLEISGGVLDVMNLSAKPWTFVFFSNETTTTSCLAELLGAAIGKALQSNSSLVLKPEDMGNEYGDAIDRLRPLIVEKKAVVVHDLLNIHPGAIQAFHSMCDRENPLVKEAVYIITIITPGYASSQRPEVFVENLLTKKFINKVDIDKLQPLITRLTDGPIIPVIPGSVPAGCTM